MDELSAKESPSSAVSWTFGDDRDTVAARAIAAGLEIEKLRTAESRYLAIRIPNGRDKRRIFVSSSHAAALLKADFEHWTMLGDYAAVLNKKTGSVEAFFRPVNRTLTNLSKLPGVVRLGEEPTERIGTETEDETSGFAAESDIDEQEVRSSSNKWKLPIPSGGTLSAEISPGSEYFRIIGRFARAALQPDRPLPSTLKIFGLGALHHDDAVRVLERLAGSLFFEMDLRYGFLLRLESVRRGPGSVKTARRDDDSRPVTMPRVEYSAEALSLYEYGRSAVGMPLLEFLAYYQAMEYFFPLFSRAAILRRLRQELSDPRFDIHSDSDLNQIVSVVSQSGRGSMPERDQLRETIASSVGDERLRAFLEDDPERLKFLTESKEIKYVRAIALRDKERRVADLVSDRVYDLRCRIVHSKEDGGTTGNRLLLPTGRESKLLTHDIDLVRFLAQKVIISAGRRADW